MASKEIVYDEGRKIVPERNITRSSVIYFNQFNYISLLLYILNTLQ